MKPTTVYDAYLDRLQQLTGLHIEFRKAADDPSREKLQVKISACQHELSAIMEKLIHENSFMRGNRMSGRSKNKSLI